MNSATAPARSLFSHLSDLAPVVKAAELVYVFLDFDGTLAPIVEDPDAAAMPEESMKYLVRLTRSRKFRVALISGRSLLDLQQRVGLDGLTYAGNHGLEIRGPGIRFTEPEAAGLVTVLRELLCGIEIGTHAMSGVLIENKGLTGSVHYRKAWTGHREDVKRIVTDAVASASHLFEVTDGLEVLEIRPLVNWNKGTAARRIMESQGNQHTLPVYLGDDATDEDAFAALAEGITVRVGRSEATRANYQLENQDAVEKFLAWLVATDEQP